MIKLARIEYWSNQAHLKIGNICSFFIIRKSYALLFFKLCHFFIWIYRRGIHKKLQYNEDYVVYSLPPTKFNQKPYIGNICISCNKNWTACDSKITLRPDQRFPGLILKSKDRLLWSQDLSRYGKELAVKLYTLSKNVLFYFSSLNISRAALLAKTV